MAQLLRLSDFRLRAHGRVYFGRNELQQLLQFYSARVAAGEWRDYALDHEAGFAAFHVFRHSFDRPLLAIVKVVDKRRAAEYAVYVDQRRIMRGQSLSGILAHFDQRISPLIRR